MTDLELTKLCAEAMEFVPLNEPWMIPPAIAVDANRHPLYRHRPTKLSWNPLHDDAHAMALVKKFGLNILRQGDAWTVLQKREGAGHSDLNRAICECVAKLCVSPENRNAVA